MRPGDPILIDDGKVRLRVVSADDTDVETEVLVGGPVSNHKGINLPGVAVSVPALSEKDVADLRFALSLSVDFIALSFVRDAKDVEDVRAIMREEGQMLPVIAKIEKPQAIDNLDEVIEAFDGFMVARGDSRWSARSRTCRSCRSRSCEGAPPPSRSSSRPRCSSR